jgi:triosephosphate isomerase
VARRTFIAGNWKLNLGPASSARLAEELVRTLADRGEVDVALYPTTISIPAVQAVLGGSGIELGVQEVEPFASGAYTGANSPVLCREAGCTRALIGHSERRQRYGETDAGVAAKTVACLDAGLLPMICVGETLQERDAGVAADIVGHQVSAALSALPADRVGALTIAYEPVWAIGTGRTASPAEAQEMHQHVRAVLRSLYGDVIADGLRVLYGGSVTPETAPALLGQPDIDGALVGGASLKAASFAAIVRASH